MGETALRSDERIGLGVAVVLHVALVALLLLQPTPSSPPIMPERMTVSLAEDVGLINQIGEWVLREACRTAVNWPESVKVPLPSLIHTLLP